MPISSTMAGSAVNHAGAGCTRCGGRVLYAVESYNMAGWRIGFMVGNKTLVSALARIKAITITAPLRRCRWQRLRRWRAINSACATLPNRYKRRRDVLVKGLHEAGWMVEMPKASMYVWAKIPNHMLLWARWNLPKLLNEAKVCVSRGLALATTATRMFALH
ncbi:hypothetical protein DMI69_22630 [Escherichia coli]|nr:hypothetical protein [Escherichia coli]